MKRFQFNVWKITRYKGFLDDLIHKGNEFIVLFYADFLIINNWEDLRGKKIERYVFFDFTPFIGRLFIIWPSNVLTFRYQQGALRQVV